MDIEQLKAALRDIVVRDWEKYQQPVYLSSLPKLLSNGFGIDYKLVLGDSSLKQFVEESPVDAGYRLVKHPKQRAKLGIVPANVNYDFPEDFADSIPDFTSQDVDAFVKIMRSLSGDELSRISLPATLVIKLLGDR